MKNNIIKERNSSLELLRILCMIVIIANHYGYHGGYPGLTYNNMSASMIFVQILSLLGKIPCQIYALITGYFLINSKASNYYRKISKIVLALLFYSVVILVVSYFIGIIPLGVNDIVKAVIPVVFDNWYIINYMLLLLIVPYLNIFINSLSKESFKKLVIILIVIWSLIPTIINCFHFISTPWEYGNLDFFIIMYFLGGYIKLYYKNMWKNIYNLLLSLFMFVVMIGLVIFLYYVGYINQDNLIIEEIKELGSMNSIITIIISVFMFLFFVNIKFKNNFINKIASTTLGIYILHENYFMRKYIWRIIYPNVNYLIFPYFHFIIKIIIIFFVCSIIEFVRKKFIADKIDDKIIDLFSNGYKKIAKRLEIFK